MTTKTNSTEKTAEVITLTEEEKRNLLNCESAIRNSLKAFYNTGRALATIRTERLYRASYSTFDKYASEKWDMTRQRVAQLIGSWRIHSMLKDAGYKVLPTTESQCRPFSRIPEDLSYDANVKAVWSKVLEAANSAKSTVTAKLVDQAVDTVLGVERKKSTGTQDKADQSTGTQDGATGSTSGAAAGPDEQSASAQHREEVRQLRAKIAYLESALAAEKQAHIRTRNSAGKTVPQSKLAKDLFKAGFRAMAHKHHPDHGGDAETFRALSSLKEDLGI